VAAELATGQGRQHPGHRTADLARRQLQQDQADHRAALCAVEPAHRPGPVRLQRPGRRRADHRQRGRRHGAIRSTEPSRPLSGGPRAVHSCERVNGALVPTSWAMSRSSSTKLLKRLTRRVVESTGRDVPASPRSRAVVQRRRNDAAMTHVSLPALPPRCVHAGCPRARASWLASTTPASRGTAGSLAQRRE
jgi:hypothetical protein